MVKSNHWKSKIKCKLLLWHDTLCRCRCPALKKFVCRAYPSLSLSYNLIKLYVLLFFISALQCFCSATALYWYTTICSDRIFCIPTKCFFSFFLAEASSSDAGCHIGYVILVYLRQYPCKKSAPSVPSPRWTGPIIRVKSRCHLCETAASHRWSNKAIRLFSW